MLQACDLRQADRVDLVGAQLGRGLVAHPLAVPRCAVRQRAPAGRLAARRKIVALDEGGEPVHRRCDALPHLVFVGCGEPAPLRLRKRGGEVPDRRAEGIVRNLGAAERAQLCQHRADDRFRRHDVLAHAFSHVRDRLRRPRGKPRNALQIGLVLRDRVQRLLGLAAAEVRQQGRHCIQLLQRQQVIGVRLEAEAGAQLAREQRVGQGVGAAQRLWVDGRQRALEPVVHREALLPLPRRDADGQLVVETVVAGQRRRDRVEARLSLVVALGERRKCRGWRDRSGRQREHDRADEHRNPSRANEGCANR